MGLFARQWQTQQTVGRFDEEDDGADDDLGHDIKDQDVVDSVGDGDENSQLGCLQCADEF